MESGLHNLVSFIQSIYSIFIPDTNQSSEHTLLVTEGGVEILTARLPDSPGGPVPIPTVEGEKVEKSDKKAEAAA
jgi:hypothetical protein